MELIPGNSQDRNPDFQNLVTANSKQSRDMSFSSVLLVTDNQQVALK